jgi:hypothetical protein
MSKRNHPSRSPGKNCRCRNARADSLLNRTGDVGENIIRVGADEPNRAHDDNQDYGQHHGILCNILAFFLTPQSPKMVHMFRPPKKQQAFETLFPRK